MRLAAGSVDSLIGKLRSIFKEYERVGDWDERLGLGNPATARLVHRYLKFVKEEQAAAGLSPKLFKLAEIFHGNGLNFEK